jgi:hypothetical protein
MVEMRQLLGIVYCGTRHPLLYRRATVVDVELVINPVHVLVQRVYRDLHHFCDLNGV